MKIQLISGIALLLLAVTSCGKPDSSDDEFTDQTGNGGEQDFVTVKGLAAYGTQCPYGSISGVKPLRVQLWKCPIGSTVLELTRDITPLFVQADCKSRTLTVRTENKKVDTSWYFMPNGEFDVVVDGISAHLAKDGNGATDCAAPLAVNLFGKVTCGPDATNMDKATIKFQSVMWAGKRLNTRGASPIAATTPTPNSNLPGSTPASSPSGTPGAALPTEQVEIPNQCHLPASCYFYTETELKQCQ